MHTPEIHLLKVMTRELIRIGELKVGHTLSPDIVTDKALMLIVYGLRLKIGSTVEEGGVRIECRREGYIVTSSKTSRQQHDFRFYMGHEVFDAKEVNKAYFSERLAEVALGYHELACQNRHTHLAESHVNDTLGMWLVLHPEVVNYPLEITTGVMVKQSGHNGELTVIANEVVYYTVPVDTIRKLFITNQLTNVNSTNANEWEDD